MTAPLPAPVSATVGVIIVTYNSRPHFPAQKAALEAQTHPFRLIVIDNASRADQRPTAADFPAGAYILQMEENTGFAAANNHGVALVTEPLAVLLNPDAFPAPDWLARLVSAAQAFPQAASFGSTQISAENPALLDGIGDCYHIFGIPWRGGYGWLATTPVYEGETFSACAAAALYRVDAWRAVGGFDESYFCYCEDVDLGFRLRLAGWQVRQAPDAVVHHVGGASSGVQSDFAVYHGTRNRFWTFVKNMPAPAFWLLLPCHIAVTAFLLLRAQGKPTAAPTWRGLRDGVRGLSAIWRARGHLKRTAPARDVLAAMTTSFTAMRKRAPVVK